MMTECELLTELARELTVPEIESNEVTAQMVAESSGVSWTRALRVLKAKEESGVLKSRKVKLPNNREAQAWSKATG